jgi:glycosyltransferase involved in cell wall biosynthesis
MKRVLYVYYGTLGVAGGYIDGIVRAAERVEGLECHFAVSAYYRFPAHRSRLLRIFFPLTELTPENPMGRSLPAAIRLPLRYLELSLAYALLVAYVVVSRIHVVNISLIDDYLLTTAFIRGLKWTGATVFVTAHDSTPYGPVVPGRRAALYQCAERVVVHYEHVRHSLVTHHAVPLEKIAVHTNPVAEVTPILDQCRFRTCLAEARRLVAGAERVILFIGILRPEKGLGDLMQAWNRAWPAAGDRVRLVIAGKPVGGVDLPEEFQRRADIVYIGRYLASEEFQAWLEVCDVVALPYSVRSYSHSAVLLMAALASKPVIASDIPLFASLVSSRNGWLFKAGDVNHLSDVLEELAGAPLQALQDKGAAARLGVVKTWETLSADLASLYEVSATVGTPGPATTRLRQPDNRR